MRCGIILAAAMTAIPFMTFAATGASAEEWCGYAAHRHAVVQCGYTSLDACENVIGKGGMCFANPYLVLDTTRRPTDIHSGGQATALRMRAPARQAGS